MRQERNYAQARARIARRKRTFLTSKERSELLQDLSKGRKIFVRIGKANHSEKSVKVNSISLNG